MKLEQVADPNEPGRESEPSPPVRYNQAPDDRSAYYMPKTLKHRHKFVAHLAALGCNDREISDRVGYTPVWVNILLHTPLVADEVERCRKQIFAGDPDQALRTMLPKGLRAIDEALDHTPSNMREHKARSDVAFGLFERTHGKALQRVDMGSSMLADIYRLLDSRVEVLPEPKTFEVELPSPDFAPAPSPAVRNPSPASPPGSLGAISPGVFPEELPGTDVAEDPFEAHLNAILGKEKKV